MRKNLLFWILLLFCGSVFAEVRFSALDLSDSDQLLFKAEADSPRTGPYQTLFLSDLKKGSLVQLSFFPEEFKFLQDSGEIQIQNRFGIFRSDSNLKNISPVGSLPAFVNGNDIQTGKINLVSTSPDGEWLVYQKVKSSAYSNLFLYDTIKKKEVVVTENIDSSLSGPRVSWSPDSRFFIYEKENALYYYALDQREENRVITEKIRKVGDGKLSNVVWNGRNTLYYIKGSLIYRIYGSQLYTRSIYSNVMEFGTIAGKIPFVFDSSFDSFWISPDSSRILLNKGERNLFMYPLSLDDFLFSGVKDSESLPYLFLPRNTRVRKVIWPSDDTLIFLTGSVLHGQNSSAIFRLSTQKEGAVSYFYKTDDKDVKDMVLSPNNKQIALVTGEKIIIRDLRLWKDTVSLPFTEPLYCAWNSNTQIIAAGTKTIELVPLNGNKREFIAFSQPGSFGFSESGKNVILKGQSGAASWKYSLSGTNWEAVTKWDPLPPKLDSKTSRVYLEGSHVATVAGSYQNLIMVRDKVGYGTRQLFNGPKAPYEHFPVEDEAVDFKNFTHGSRIRRREVAVVFNAVDSVEGLTDILNTLSEYNLRCTFFVNGEFIRRHPGAVKELSDSGHEIGSLFYSNFNMTDSAFEMDENFLKQGMARNEDDYFKATGKEISLIWHAPFYFVNSRIIETAGKMNYAYVGRDVDSLDWVTEDDAYRSSGVYMPSAKLIERIEDLKKPGSIISVRVGVTGRGRNDYLFKYLDVLINDLISRGYAVVPVTTLMEHAK